MSSKESKEAQKFYMSLRLKGNKYEFENSLGVKIKCFGVVAPNGHAELHEQDIIVGLLGMVLSRFSSGFFRAIFAMKEI